MSSNKVLDLVLELLSSDESSFSHTSLDISDTKHDFALCLYSTTFSYNNSLYKQTFGTLMGFCISPVIANIYMEHVERKAITAFHSLRLCGWDMLMIFAFSANNAS